MYFAYIFIFLVFIITVLSFFPVTCEIYYEYINKVQKAEITIRLFKIIKIKVPVKLNKEEKAHKRDTKKSSQERKSFTLSKIKKTFSDITDALSDAKSDIHAFFSSLAKRIVLEKVLLETEYGLSDAAKTGMSYGAVWGVVSCMLSSVDNFSEIKDLTLNIYPVFDRECFNLRTNCIISAKTAHIISIGIIILKIINRFSKIIAKD